MGVSQMGFNPHETGFFNYFKAKMSNPIIDFGADWLTIFYQ
jgi:hypothetical protein